MRRLCLRYGATGHRKSSESLNTPVSAVLDAYTSVFSNDVDAEQAELYFTNTASLAIGQYKYSLPVMALRRAGRFIWSDTPFVNFFTLIYIATVLKGKSTLRLQDYVTFRSIAIVEWVFMKAKLASAVPDSQIGLIRKLIASKRIVLHEPHPETGLLQKLEVPSRNDIAAFTTTQRMQVMFGKSSIAYELGSVMRSGMPARIPMPAVGTAIDGRHLGWKLYRQSERVMILVDCLAESKPKSRWGRFCRHAHGMLLRRIGKRRAVYLIEKQGPDLDKSSQWHSDRNLVTGVSETWLEESFAFGGPSIGMDFACLH
ncbi:MAG: hypothetical protein OHK93_008402 [Ramalina farinacea]|uniref:Uncharacterized protein n=1 Tax=Ramalina farinacea TaxID=258253 RepID=A0AA43QPG1_9LECA|nr:hypothetical protein [Ramalina farinacea]